MSKLVKSQEHSFNNHLPVDILSLGRGPKGMKALQTQLLELWYLLRIEFKNIQESWVWSVIMISLFPLITITFLSFFMVNPTEETMTRVITGTMVFPIILMGMNTYAIELSLAKHNGHFVFYSSLPISKINFVFAKLISGFLMTLPSVIIMTMLGQLMFGITLNFSSIIVPIMILCIGCCVGLGMMLGFLSPNHQLTNLGSQSFMMLVSFLTPIMIPIEQLPKPLQFVSYAVPTTYVAESFHTLFTTGWDNSVGINIVILTAFFILFLVLVLWKMEWRVER
ncbi:ABC transporter permease [Metabacillus fastidiosus]|uniref:ABC transporter permease n=1 Tax=Metabacillus fastidiosus TaxID=1458 RepID=UPI003D295EA9